MVHEQGGDRRYLHSSPAERDRFPKAEVTGGSGGAKDAAKAKRKERSMQAWRRLMVSIDVVVFRACYIQQKPHS